jgi:adenylate cyclase
MRRFLYAWMHYLLPLAVLVGAVALRVEDPQFLQTAQLKLFDLYQQRFPRKYEPVPVRIIDIDDETLEKTGQWPWPRVRVAELIVKLANAGASVIAFDIVFAEADRTSPKQILPLWATLNEGEGLKPVLDQLMEQVMDHDAALAEVIAQVPVVAGYTLTKEQGGRRPATKWGIVVNGDDPKRFLETYQGAQVNLASIEQAAMGNGSFAIEPEADNIVRKVPLVMRWGDQIYPSLAAEALRLAQRNAQGKPATTYVIRTSNAQKAQAFGAQTGVERVRIGRLEAATDEKARLWLHFTQAAVPERTIPVWKVMEDKADPKLLEDAIVFIGTSAAGLKDIRATPVSAGAPGVEMHALATEQVLLQHFLQRPDFAFGAEVIFTVGLGLLLVLLIPKLGALWVALLAFGSIGTAVAGSTYLFVEQRMLLDPVMPSIMVLAVYLTGSLLSYIKTEGQRRYVRDAMGQYLSPEYVKLIEKNPELLKLGGETRNMTVLFSDVRGFTTISEQFKGNPQGLIVLMNRFLTPLSDVIMERGGCIDKYMGDAIMAFWNAPLPVPDHAHKACETALVMLEEIGRVNIALKQEAEAENRPFYALNIGVGLNTGDVVVGNMGSTKKYGYTVMGDAVNLASRLEGQSKSYHVGTVMGEETYKQAAGYAMLELDLIAVKGKMEAVRIFTLIGRPDVEQDPVFQEVRALTEKMHAAYRWQHWDEAEALAKECKAKERWHLGEFYDMYLERFAEYRANSPPADWDGVYVATSK